MTLKSAPVFLADDLGFFGKEGLQVDLVTKQTGIEAAKALFEGQADVATVPEHLAAAYSLNRDDFRILASINRSRTHELVARRDRGIESVADLGGKKVALAMKSQSLYWLNRLLIYNSLSLEDVVLVDALPSRGVTMCVGGEVDALVTWHPHAYKARTALGENAFLTSAQLGQDMFWLLIARDRWIDDDPGRVVRFLRALVEAERSIEESPDTAKGRMRHILGLDGEYLDFEWQLHDFHVELPQQLLLALEQQAAWAIQEGKIERSVPNYLKYLYFDALSSVRPETLTIIH